MGDKPPKRRWLVLAYAFNMDGRAASQTVTDKVPYLLAEGIELTVLSSRSGRRDTRFQHLQFQPWGPSGLRFEFRHIVARRFGRGLVYRVTTALVSLLLLPFVMVERLVFGLANFSSWAIPASIKGTRLVRTGDYELVFSSGGAWCAHLAAAWIKRRTGIKWIAEIHDPMVIRDDPDDDGTRPRANRNDRFVQHLEGVICREADHVWWFTRPALDFAKHRHPELGDKGFVVYPGAEPPEVQGQHLPGEHLVLSHFGSLTNDRSLSPVITALANLVQDYPQIRQDLRIHTYGTNLDPAAREVLAGTDLADMIVEFGRLEFDPKSGLSGRARVTKKMYETDVLLLLHGDYEWCAEYIPSKLYEYFWARRPVFAVTNRSESLDEMLAKRKAYLCHTHEPASIETALRRMHEDWRAGHLNEAAGEPVTVESAVRQILAQVSG